MNKFVNTNDLKNGGYLMRENNQRESKSVSKDNFVIGYNTSQKTLKIGSSVINGRRPFKDVEASKHHHEEKIAFQVNSKNVSKNEEHIRNYRNADTSDTFHKNSE